MNASITAGVLAGMVGLIVFLVIHHIWIMPIWFILPVGLIIAGLGGLAVGWAYGELLPHLPGRPWNMLAVIGLIWVILLPAILLAELRAPLFVMTDGSATLNVSVARAVVVFVLELVLTAGLAGALAGWWIGGTGRSALALALAGVIFALGPGHNIPFIGSTTGVAKELALMMAIIVPAALVLVEGEAWLSGLRIWAAG